jgi:hypothetical protein
MRMLLCFDKEGEAQEAMEEVAKGAPNGPEPRCLHSEKLTTELKAFFDAVDAALKGKARKTNFDGYDLILLDNNLSHLDIKGARLTGEDVAGFFRAFTTTPYIVSLNKNSDLDFDLEYLVGIHDTRADLAVNTDHLANRALWTGNVKDSPDGFRPWYWPALSDEPNRRRRQIKFVQGHFKKPILSALHFPKSAVLALSRRAKGVLSPEGQQPTADASVERPITTVTFEQFFRSSSRSVPAEEDRKNLADRDDRTATSRVIAGDLDFWLRRDVLGPQDVLVDAPHLLLRMPFLLGKKASSLSAWNATTSHRQPPFGFDAAIYKRYLRAHRFKEQQWTPRPTFWGSAIKADKKLNDLFFASEKASWGDFVFCEDVSTFVDRPNEESMFPQEFVAEFESPWNRRYVRVLEQKSYVPRSRLAL